MPTPHNSAAPGDYASAVLMPGDPRRAARIAETFLYDTRLVSEVRGVDDRGVRVDDGGFRLELCTQRCEAAEAGRWRVGSCHDSYVLAVIHVIAWDFWPGSDVSGQQRWNLPCGSRSACDASRTSGWR